MCPFHNCRDKHWGCCWSIRNDSLREEGKSGKNSCNHSREEPCDASARNAWVGGEGRGCWDSYFGLKKGCGSTRTLTVTLIWEASGNRDGTFDEVTYHDSHRHRRRHTHPIGCHYTVLLYSARLHCFDTHPCCYICCDKDQSLLSCACLWTHNRLSD